MRTEIEDLDLAEQLAERAHQKELREEQRAAELNEAKHEERMRGKQRKQDLKGPKKRPRMSQKQREARERREADGLEATYANKMKTGGSGKHMDAFIKARDAVYAEYEAAGRPVPEEVEEHIRNSHMDALRKDQLQT